MYSQCSQYNVSWGDVLREGGHQAGLEGDPSWEVVPCQQGWEYRWVATIMSTTITTTPQHGRVPRVPGGGAGLGV